MAKWDHLLITLLTYYYKSIIIIHITDESSTFITIIVVENIDRACNGVLIMSYTNKKCYWAYVTMATTF